MGLDLGIIHIEHLDRPEDLAYEFAWYMAVEEANHAYMWGEGNSWIPFTQRQILELLADFAGERRLADAGRQEILEWVRSLPWIGWEDNFRLDDQPNEVGGLIELYFNW